MQLSKAILAIASSAAFFTSALAVSGDATWFNPGLGACGQNNGDNDFVAALNTADFANRANCGRRARVTADNGRFVDVTIVDLCPGCGPGGIDLSPIAFQQLADLGVGRIHVNWNFI